MVVAFHAGRSVIPGGFIGVDVFFVISGYLITGILLPEIHERRFSLTVFYARRFRRILPALLAVLVASFMMGFLILFPDELSDLGKQTAAAAAFAANILFWKDTGYFDTPAEAKPLLHLWSLGVEEQFYLIWPLTLLLIARIKKPFSAAAIVLILSFVANLWTAQHDAAADFYLIHSRLWELLAGGLVAIAETRGFLDKYLSSHLPERELMAFAGLAALLVSSFALNRSMIYPAGWSVGPVAGTVLIIVAGPRSWVNRVVLSNPVTVFVGLISYPLYLWHWPLLVSLSFFTFGASPLAVKLGKFAVIGVAFLLAWLTWVAIETPVKRRLTPLPVRKATTVVAASMAALCVALGVGLVTWWMDGFPSRYGADQRVKLRDADIFYEAWNARDHTFLSCGPEFGGISGVTRCHKRAEAPPTVALFGDSHADHLFPGLAETFRARGENLLFIGHHGCPPLTGVEIYDAHNSFHCLEANRVGIELLARTASIHTVILVSRGPLYITGHDFGPGATIVRSLRPENPAESSKQPSQLFFDALSRTITRLEVSGKEVILAEDIPELETHPASCLSRLNLPPRNADCSVRRSIVDARQKEHRAIAAGLASVHPRLRVIDLDSGLCDAAKCYAERGGRILYRDSNHLSLVGSDFVANEFMRNLELEETARRNDTGSVVAAP